MPRSLVLAMKKILIKRIPDKILLLPAFTIFKFFNIRIFQFKRHAVCKIALLLALCIGRLDTSAQDSSHIRISLLTCSPGDEMYSTFGHSALRITDSSNVSDIVFNYGTFDFDEPDFYSKFLKGRLLYYVSTMYFEDFKEEYLSTGRSITEQVINFSAAEKIALENFIYTNAREENKYYNYDFFLDNCTTRLRDIIVNYKKNYPPLKPTMPANTSFRQAIHNNLYKYGKYWNAFAIDILFGLAADRPMTTSQSEFLPDNLLLALDTSSIQQPLISQTTIMPAAEVNENSTIFTPLVVFSLLLLIVVGVSFSENKTAKIVLNGFDGLLFFLTGVMGILFIFLWFASGHTIVKTNLNLVWAWPTHAVIAFFINNKKSWVKNYFGFTTIGMVIVLFAWFFLPQQMNNSLLPIVFILLYRSVRRYQVL
jgi:hypothetical protein